MSTELQYGDVRPNNLRELRLRAGLSQKELSERSGVHAITICHIEKGKVKPRELTRARLIKALSEASEKDGQEEKTRADPGLFGDLLGRDEFFLKLKEKMCLPLRGFFDQVLISKFIESAEFFSRQRYYPGDFATAVEIIGALLKAQKRLREGDGWKLDSYPRRAEKKREGRCRKKR